MHKCAGLPVCRYDEDGISRLCPKLLEHLNKAGEKRRHERMEYYAVCRDCKMMRGKEEEKKRCESAERVRISR